MNEVSNAIHRYRLTDGSGLPHPETLSANEDNSGVIDLALHQPEWWWSGMIACVHCDYVAPAIIECDGRKKPSKRVACPQCACEAEPSAYWSASGRLVCTCGIATVHVVLSDHPIPVIVACSCGATYNPEKATEFNPWPEGA